MLVSICNIWLVMPAPPHFPDEYPGWAIYGDTYTEAGLYIMVTPVPWPDCKLW